MARPTRKRRAPTPEPPREEPFPYRDYVRAQRLLTGALQRGPLYALLTGETGTGKTCLKQAVAAGLDPHRHQLLYLSATANASSVGLARFLARAFRVTPKRSYVETVADLMAALRAHAAHVVLWLDEADQLPHKSLSELRGLAESDGKPDPVFSVVLSGLPELRTILDAHDLFPLKRRLALRCVLAGVCRDELDAFLLHRFGSAGAARLAAEAREELFERTRATPALLHKAVAYALDLAGEDQPVGEEDCRAAFDALGL